MSKRTYTQQIYEPRLFDLSKECGDVYNEALIFYKKVLRKKSIFLSNKSISRYIENSIPRVLLHSQSFQACYQKLFDNIKSYFNSLKEYEKNKSKYSNKPKLVKRRKFFQPIQFKKSAIRYKDGFLMLSLSKGNDPLKFRWNNNISIPDFIVINWNKNKRYWQLNCVLEESVTQENLDKFKTLSLDLGVKRIATSYDGKEAITFNGKKIRSLISSRNKINAKTQSKLSNLKKGSRKYKKIKRANSNVNLRRDNQIKDILHKTSRTIVNKCIIKKIGKIVIGDCSGVHTNTNCGAKNNQQIQQNPEQKLKKYIEYKMISIGGIVETIPENYTSQTCPSCSEKTKPTNRIYKCSYCGFKDDRDVVGAKNIYKVSFGIDIKTKLDVIGFLTKPRGWKYKTNFNCEVRY